MKVRASLEAKFKPQVLRRKGKVYVIKCKP